MMRLSFRIVSVLGALHCALSSAVAQASAAYGDISSDAGVPSAQPTTTHFTQTTTLTRTEVITLSTTKTSMTSTPSPSISKVTYTTLPTNAYETAPIYTQARSTTTYTVIRITTSSCSAGQTVTQEGSVHVLATPSLTTFLTTTTMTRSACTTSTSVMPVAPLRSYVPVGYNQTLPTPGSAPPPSATQAGSSPLTLSTTVQDSITFSSLFATVTSTLTVTSIAPIGTAAISLLSTTSPAPAVPYPSTGLETASISPSGTLGAYPGYTSGVAPYNPASAAASLRDGSLSTTFIMVVVASIFLVV